MRFTVIWSPIAEAHFTEVWASNPHQRNAITLTSHQLYSSLRDDPQRKGRPLGDYRVVIESPLKFVYYLGEMRKGSRYCGSGLS